MITMLSSEGCCKEKITVSGLALSKRLAIVHPGTGGGHRAAGQGKTVDAELQGGERQVFFPLSLGFDEEPSGEAPWLSSGSKGLSRRVKRH